MNPLQDILHRLSVLESRQATGYQAAQAGREDLQRRIEALEARVSELENPDFGQLCDYRRQWGAAGDELFKRPELTREERAAKNKAAIAEAKEWRKNNE